ncbi:MAG: hypothetical protein MRZ79_12860 [Bacteroidia bacterium]|nr:hypothetical protein [Bacteroidia bacterium]
MKKSIYFGFICGFIVLIPHIITAQYYSPHKSSLESYTDLPDLVISKITPAVASDLTYLQYASADTFLVECHISGFLLPNSPKERIEILVYPGNQEVVVPVMGLKEGWYQMMFFCKNRKVGDLWIQICR